MKDCVYPLRKAYYAALSGITYNAVAVAIYYNQAPADNTADNFITFGNISSSDGSTMNSADTNTSIQVRIHTRADIDNPGLAADAIAGSVLSAVYNTPSSVFDLSADSLQMCSTKLSSDTTMEYNIDGGKAFVDRILTFSHYIRHS